MSSLESKSLFNRSRNETKGTEKEITSRNNYHKLVEYIIHLAPVFLQIFIRTWILGNRSFCEFLTRGKHSLFHLYETKECCECDRNYRIKRQTLIKDQFLMLYDKNTNIPRNKKCRRFNLKICPCVITAKTEVKIEMLDIKLILLIFERHLEPDAKESIMKIIEIRNNVFHLSDLNKVDEAVFNNYWESLSSSLRNILRVMEPRYIDDLEKEENYVMSQWVSTVENDNMLLLESVSKDRSDTLQLQLDLLEQTTDKTYSMKEIKEKLHTKITSLCFCLNRIAVSVFGDKSLTALCDNSDQYFNNDKKTITVLFHMVVPNDFDENDMAKSIEQLAMTFKEEENIGLKIKEIYTGELKILLEILTRVARSRPELQKEIKKVVLDILETSQIDTSQASSVEVTLTKIDEKGGFSDSSQPSETDTVYEAPQEGLVYDAQGQTFYPHSSLISQNAVQPGPNAATSTAGMTNIHFQERSSPPLVPENSFNAKYDASSLKRACLRRSGLFGNDYPVIVGVLSRRSNKQRQEISAMYKTLYERDLIADLATKLRSDIELPLALFKPTTFFDAYSLHKAMSGVKRKKSVLIEILLTRTNEEIREIEECYQQNYNSNLKIDIWDETCVHLERILISACLGLKTELTPKQLEKVAAQGVESVIDRNLARRDATNLYEAGVKGLKNEVFDTFRELIVFNHYYQLRATFEEFYKLAGKDFSAADIGELSVNNRIDVIKALVNRPKYFAERLNNAMAGNDTNYSTLIRVIVSRSEIDLQEIKAEYFNMYHRTLYNDVARTNMYNNKLLLGIIGF